jgi:hypothetical protein
LQRILLDNHPAILALTFIVSLLHTIFDFLAFKNGNFSSSKSISLSLT